MPEIVQEHDLSPLHGCLVSEPAQQPHVRMKFASIWRLPTRRLNHRQSKSQARGDRRALMTNWQHATVWRIVD
jgi:hypothetical protein